MYRVCIELYKHEWKFGRTRNAVGTRAAGECFHSNAMQCNAMQYNTIQYNNLLNSPWMGFSEVKYLPKILS